MPKCLFIPIVLCILSSCIDSGKSLDDLQYAESLMHDRPDSALFVLKDIDRSSLKSRHGKARFALLYSQALDKNYIDVDTDTLTSRALKYYRYRGKTQERALAYYYSGRTYENAGNIDSAIIQYTNTEELLKSSTDIALRGLTASALARLYDSQYFVEMAKDKYLEAADLFLKYGNIQNALIVYGRALGMFSLAKDYAGHEHYYNLSVNLAKELRDTVALIGLEQSRADRISEQYSDHRAALNVLRHSMEIYCEGNAPDKYRFILADLYTKIGKPDSALLYMRPLLDRLQNESSRGKLEYLYMAGRIYRMKSDFAKAYSYTDQALIICDSLYFAEKDHTIPELQAKYRTDQLATHNKYLKRINRYQLYIAAISLVLLLFISLWLIDRRQKRILRQEREITEYRNVITQLKAEYEELQSCNQGKGNEETVNRRISFLKQILETTVQFGHNKETFYAKIEQLLTKSGTGPSTKSGGANEILLIFQDILNARTPGIVEYLHRKYPSLSLQELSLYCMIAMNISKTAMCLVLNTSQKTYYNYRILLRNKLNLTNEDITIEEHYLNLCKEYETLGKKY